MRCLSRVLFVLAALALLPLSAWAQSEGPIWSRLNVIKVKPEYIDEFIELQKQISARNKARGVPWRTAWRVASFGNTYQFAFSSPLASFASLDNPPEPDLAIRSKFTKYVVDRDSYASIYRPDLSIPLPEGKTPTLAVVTMNTIAPGRNADYVKFLETDVLPYMRKPEARIEGFAVLQRIFGGSVGWTTVTYHGSYGRIDDGSPARLTLDDAARAALAKKLVGIVTHRERILARYVPELSYSTPSATDGQD